MSGAEIDSILEKFAKDIEAAVHALYRGDVRQATARARTDGIVRDAVAAVRASVQAAVSTAAAPAATAAASAMPSPRPSVAAPVVAGAAAGWTREEGEAVLKCITAWLPMGPPKTADPDGKCVPAMRDLTPSWGQREIAREAVRKISQP